jgi:hypothetical protein
MVGAASLSVGTRLLRNSLSIKSFEAPGRGGRVVEGSGLENRQGRKSFVSSNLTHAVMVFFDAEIQ